jgi:hypothetical protein
MEWNELQIKGKGGEVTLFPQYRECGDVRELVVTTRSGVECDTDEV